MANRALSFMGSKVTKVRPSHIKKIFQDPQKVMDTCVTQICVKQAVVQRMASGIRPKFRIEGGVLIPTSGPLLRVPPARLHSVADEYIAQSEALKKEIVDPQFGTILAVLAAIAALLAKAAESEAEQDKALKKLESDLLKDVAILKKNEAELKRLKLDKNQLDKDAKTWFGSIVQAVTGSREANAAKIAKIEGDLDSLQEIIAARRHAIGDIKIQQMILEVEL